MPNYRFVGLHERVRCAHERDCTEPAVCDGRQAQCPAPQAKRDNDTECNEGTQVGIGVRDALNSSRVGVDDRSLFFPWRT